MKSVANVFRGLPVASSVCRAAVLPVAAVEYARDTITLGWEERLKVRARRITDSGVEFATALPRGTVLRDGDCLVLDALRLVVHVAEEVEPVLVIRPTDA